MAKKLQRFSFPIRGSYPWGEWLNGDPWLLTPGVDFTVNVPVFRAVMYHVAARRGMKSKAKMTPEGLVIQAFPKDE